MEAGRMQVGSTRDVPPDQQRTADFCGISFAARLKSRLALPF
jgi:hypothetical protein